MQSMMEYSFLVFISLALLIRELHGELSSMDAHLLETFTPKDSKGDICTINHFTVYQQDGEKYSYVGAENRCICLLIMYSTV